MQRDSCPSTRQAVTLALAAAFALACSDATAPSDGVAMTFTASPITGVVPPPTPSAAVVGGVLTVSGQVMTPTPCYAVSGQAEVASDTLFVHVVAKSTLSAGAACEQIVQVWRYIGTINRIPSNAIMLQVTYDPGKGKPTVVLGQPLITP